jgi:hypothetical protein
LGDPGVSRAGGEAVVRFRESRTTPQSLEALMFSRCRLDVCRAAAPIVLAVGLGACGGGDSSQPPPTTQPPPPVEEKSTEPRVFFVSPTDGAEVTSPVSFEFGAENVSVDPVEEPPVVMEGSVHYHIGYDIDCLPAGEVIPKADPWVHFGDGSAVYETQLDPGSYKLTLQAGDGEHRTLEGEGFCQTISITVVEGDSEEAESAEAEG